MTRALFDTNVILDVLLDRKPHVEASAAAWAAVETGVSEGLLAAHAVTTISLSRQKRDGRYESQTDRLYDPEGLRCGNRRCGCHSRGATIAFYGL